MLGYDLLAQANLEYWNLMLLSGAVALNTFIGGLALKEDNALETTVNGQRKVVVRRYQIKKGKLVVLYTDMMVPTTYGNYYNSPVKDLAPEGTEWKYLTCQKEWGFTEEIPPSPVVVFMDPSMQEDVSKILQNE